MNAADLRGTDRQRREVDEVVEQRQLAMSGGGPVVDRRDCIRRAAERLGEVMNVQHVKLRAPFAVGGEDVERALYLVRAAGVTDVCAGDGSVRRKCGGQMLLRRRGNGDQVRPGAAGGDGADLRRPPAAARGGGAARRCGGGGGGGGGGGIGGRRGGGFCPPRFWGAWGGVFPGARLPP